MRTDTVYKRAYNDALDLCAKMGSGNPVPSESVLGAQLGVSRTTVRKILTKLRGDGVLADADARGLAIVSGDDARRFPEAETVPTSAYVEHRFMEWMLRDDAAPGTSINEMEMARLFGVATTAVREFLIRFQRFGLIGRRPNGGWLFKGFTAGFALELFEIREMFELRSARAFASLPADSLLWLQLEELRKEHRALSADFELRYRDFSDLDRRFHLLINAASPNRFIDGFYDIISMVFHYHYQWNKIDERQRNEAAIREHLDYIDALFDRDLSAVETACRVHLGSARATLLRSTSGHAVSTPFAPRPRMRSRKVVRG